MTNYRLKILQFIIPLLTLAVVVRLFYWQVVRGEELQSRASSQYERVVTLPASRGSILSADDAVLAGSQTLYLLYAYKPQLSQETTRLVDDLAPILATTTEIASSAAEILPTTEERLASAKSLLQDKLATSRSWVALKHHLTSQQKSAIAALNIEGLGFDEEIVRYYPEASLSAHLLGFVGQDQAGQPQGYFGLEGYYDRQLQGRGGLLRQQTDASGNPILVGDFSRHSSLDGRTLKTTLNRSAQYHVEKLLDRALEKYGASQGTVIVMQPQTGAIVALANSPRYDPRIFYKYPASLHKNPAVADLFEPGSIFKPLVMAAAIDAKAVTPDTRCDQTCDHAVTIGEFTIKTWNDQYHPATTMTETLIHSDNTGMIFAARQLGSDKLLDYLNKFGLSKTTGIDLQEEISGKLKTTKDFKEIDLATTSFGQGIAITPVQMLAAANVLANTGVWVQPYLVDSIITDDQTISPPHTTRHQVLSSDSAKLLTQMLVAAVDQGEAKWVKPKGVSIAGKTGTAQIPVAGHYDKEKTIASFIGFAPADNPQFTMLVTLREPTTSPWGSETAAPLWFDIARELLLLDL